jgi:hypothetical protein
MPRTQTQNGRLQDVRNTRLWNLLAQAEHKRNVQKPIGKPPAAVTQVL